MVFAHTFGSVLVAIITPVILMIILWQILPILDLVMLLFAVTAVIIPIWMKRKQMYREEKSGSSGRCQCGNVRRSAGVKRNTDSEL